MAARQIAECQFSAAGGGGGERRTIVPGLPAEEERAENISEEIFHENWNFFGIS